MNPQITSELSLYQLTQSLDTPPPSLVVNASTFKGWINTLIQFLINQRISATVWVKLPPTPQWLSIIESYQLEELAKQIYICEIDRINDTPTAKSSSSSRIYDTDNGMTPIVLETSSQLKREYFCLILSPQLCSLILVQEQSVSSRKDASSKLLEPSMLKMVYSFDPMSVETVLIGIKQAITITDTTPVELMDNSVLPFPFPKAIDSHLLTQLWHQYLNNNQSIQQTSNADKDVSLQVSSPTCNFTVDENFLNALTREISTPLTNIKTALRLLESMQHKREPRQRYLNLLKGECDRQTSLINSLQELAQLPRLAEENDICVKLEDLVPGIVSIYQPIANEQGIALGYTIPAGLPPIACPSAWLRQILRNLLQNSLKFTLSQGRVYVQASLKSEEVELIVSDTGIGIEQSDLPKIFNIFYRGRNTMGEDTTSSGLGLAMVRQLINQCGGKITVSSQVRKGTVFKMLLPIVK